MRSQEGRLELGRDARPLRAVELVLDGDVDTERLDECPEEHRLDGTDCDVPTAGALVGPVVRGPAVHEVALSLVGRRAGAAVAVGRREQGGHTVDHRDVHHLARSRPPSRQEGRENPVTANMPPPPKSPTRLSGGMGRPPLADGREGTGHRDVVDVVAAEPGRGPSWPQPVIRA